MPNIPNLEPIPHDRPEEIGVGEMAQILATFFNMAPPCPQCHTKRCPEWLKKYFEWIIKAMLGPYGFMAMFIALLERAGGSIPFTQEELDETKHVLKVGNEHNELDKLWRAYIQERADRPADDHDWPSIIN